MLLFYLPTIIYNEVLFHSFSAEGMFIGILIAMGMKRRSFAGFLTMMVVATICSLYFLKQPYILLSNDIHTNHIIIGKYNFIIGAVVGYIIGVLSFRVSKQAGSLRKRLTIIMIFGIPLIAFAIEEVFIRYTLFR